MTNEEFQNLVLDELAGLNARIDAQGKQLNARIDAQGEQLNARLDAQSEQLAHLSNRQDAQMTIVGNTDDQLKHVQHNLHEHSDYLKAIQYNQEIARAEINGLKLTTASADGLKEMNERLERCATKEDLNASIKALNDDLFLQKVELNKLKLA